MKPSILSRITTVGAGLLLVSFFFPGGVSAVELADLVAPGARVARVARGFQFTEGPAWGPQGFLVFSDIPASRIVKLNADGTTENFVRPSGGANGLMFDRAGFLYACQGGSRQVVRIDVENGREITVLANRFDGKRLNSPNDLALDSHGGLYFTDPRYGGGGRVEQPVMGVYYIDSSGTTSRVIDDLGRPNGILVSPDGLHLYVAQPDQRRLYRYKILAPGQLAEKTLIFTGDARDGNGPDGMAHDVHGNIYATYSGLVILEPDGRLIGRVRVPENPANCTFGGDDNKTLFITARTSLYRLSMNVEGMGLQEGRKVEGDAPFVRGDFNVDSRMDISDPVGILLHLFRAGRKPACFDAADANDDGALNLSDAVDVLTFLFLRGPPPSSPFPGCGSDPTADDLGCADSGCPRPNENAP